MSEENTKQTVDSPDGSASPGEATNSSGEASKSLPNDNPTPDVEAIMAQIREEVGAFSSANLNSRPRYVPPGAAMSNGELAPVLYSDELNFLNAHWGNWSEQPPIESHRPLLGRFIVKIKSRIRHFLWNSLFHTYFERERAFQMNLVRYLNAAARYVDGRDAELFWRLVNKMDSDVAAVNERMDSLFLDARASQNLANREDLLQRKTASTKGS